jgi:hypothetical protein
MIPLQIRRKSLTENNDNYIKFKCYLNEGFKVNDSVVIKKLFIQKYREGFFLYLLRYLNSSKYQSNYRYLEQSDLEEYLTSNSIDDLLDGYEIEKKKKRRLIKETNYVLSDKRWFDIYRDYESGYFTKKFEIDSSILLKTIVSLIMLFFSVYTFIIIDLGFISKIVFISIFLLIDFFADFFAAKDNVELYIKHYYSTIYEVFINLG